MDGGHLTGNQNTTAGVAALRKLMHSYARRLSSQHVYSFRLNLSASFTLFFRSLMTKVLFSPKVDHEPRGTSLKSTNPSRLHPFLSVRGSHAQPAKHRGRH